MKTILALLAMSGSILFFGACKDKPAPAQPEQAAQAEASPGAESAAAPAPEIPQPVTDAPQAYVQEAPQPVHEAPQAYTPPESSAAEIEAPVPSNAAAVRDSQGNPIPPPKPVIHGPGNP